jgi:alpha/beta superfamily hydrolase
METTAKLETVQIPVTPGTSVSGVLGIPEWWPTGERVGVVIAHDTNTTMEQELVTNLHLALADRGDLTLRFNFPYVEEGKRRPDAPTVLQRTLRAAIAFMLGNPQNAPARLVIAGLGLGGRTAGQVVAQGSKADGLIMMSYPLHPVGKPGQMTKDPTCRLERLKDVMRRIGAPTSLRVVEDADHGFGVAKRSPRTPEEVHSEVIEVAHRFIRRVT